MERIENWDAASKKKALEAFRAQVDNVRMLWYCDRVRSCDGKPHEGYLYKHARADQWPPPGTNWFLWLLMSGRGAGKTRSGAGWTKYISKYTGRIAGVGRRGTDFRDTMVEGESGLIRVCEAAGETWDWKPALKEFRFQNGALVKGFSAEEPDSLRGPNNGAAWLDEPAFMELIELVWSNLLLTLRLPGLPGGAKALCTTTPKTIPWLREQIKKPNTRMVRVSTMANIDNLDSAYYENVIKPLIGTRDGRQEIEGELLEDIVGALWKSVMLKWETPEEIDTVSLDRIVVAIDPAGTSNKKSDETGIITVGKRGELGYVLDDASGRLSPKQWADAAIRQYEKYQADAIIVETNFGGDMVRRNLAASKFDGRIIESRAVRGKQTRAEPVVHMYEQEKITHSKGLPIPTGHGEMGLEDEMLTWVPGEGASPNRVDALVWGFTELFGIGGQLKVAAPLDLEPPSNDPLYGRHVS